MKSEKCYGSKTLIFTNFTNNVKKGMFFGPTFFILGISSKFQNLEQ